MKNMELITLDGTEKTEAEGVTFEKVHSSAAKNNVHYVFSATCEDLDKLYHPGLAAPEYHILKDLVAEVYCNVYFREDHIQIDTTYGLKGCSHGFPGVTNNFAPAQDVEKACWKCFWDTYLNCMDLSGFADLFGRCIKEHYHKCENCPCEELLLCLGADKTEEMLSSL